MVYLQHKFSRGDFKIKIGQKLMALEELIYVNAKRQIDELGIDDTIGAFVMNAVYGRFLRDANYVLALEQATEETEKDELPKKVSCMKDK